VESQIKTWVVPVRTKRIGGSFVGWIDLGQCTCIGERKGWNRGDGFDCEALFLTRDGRFFVEIFAFKTEFPTKIVEDYAVSITELQAAGWYAEDPKSAPECIRPLVEKLDLTKAPTNEKIILDKNQVCWIAGMALLFVQSVAELKIHMCAGDAPVGLSQHVWYAQCADRLNHVLDPKRWEWTLEGPLSLLVERDLTVLGLGFAMIKHDSGLSDANLSNFLDPTWDDVEPLFDGHEHLYWSLFAASARLLRIYGSPLEVGPNPFEPPDNAPIAPPAPVGRAPAPPADRPEVIAAPPSWNGTDATNCPAPEAIAARPLVILGEPGDNPIVNGKTKKRLLLTQFHVIKALMEAGTNGLSKDELVNKSAHSDAVNILKRPRDSDADWKSVTQTGEIPGGRYRVSV